jgi:hypothetical protein
MKQKQKIISFFIFSLLTHYFVLTFFQTNSTETFVGKVEKIESQEIGLFPKADVVFAINNEINGENKIIMKTISLMKNDLNKLKIGTNYKVQTHNNWLLNIK